MEYPSNPYYEEPNDAISSLCNDLIESTYNPDEFNNRMKLALPTLYDRLIDIIKYFLKITVTNEKIKPTDNYRSYCNKLERIKFFGMFFGELIYDYEVLAKMGYIIRIYKKFEKAVYEDIVFDRENRYRYTRKGLEMCKFADLFFEKDEYNSDFLKFYCDCHSSLSEEELDIKN